MNYEQALAAAYGWTVKQIGRTPAAEVLHHVALTQQKDAADKLWQLQVTLAKYSKPDDLRSLVNDLQERSQPDKKRTTAYDQVDPVNRVLLIGSALSVGGEKWRVSHGRQVDWLRSQGITVEEAIRRHRERLERDRAMHWAPSLPRPVVKVKPKKRKT